MGERSGVGLVECTILEALDSLGAGPDQPYCMNARALAAVEARIGLAAGYAYEVLLDLARRWTLPVSLISGCGNFGSRAWPAAGFRYTESRLSPAGQVALAAERGDLAPVPIGLINGNTYREGTRPPFRPQAIIEALRRVIEQPGIASDDLIAIIGPPSFQNGCTVTGDFAALAAARPTVLTLRARLTVSEDHASVRITNLPPNADPDDTMNSIASLARVREWVSRRPDHHRRAYLPLKHIRDESPLGLDADLLVCTPDPGTTAEQLRDHLMEIYGVYTEVQVALPRPLDTMIREWAEAYRSEDLVASLTALENAIRIQYAFPLLQPLAA